MGSKGSTQVEAVDPWEVGRADATFNRIDQYTPFGNLTYSGPNRNQAELRLNPFLAGNEERRMLSDRILLDTALGRQVQMNEGGLPSLTSGINPGALQQFFGLPSSLQTGFDQAPTPPTPPNVIRGSDTPSGAKGGGGQPSGGVKGGAAGGGSQLPGPPPGGPPPLGGSFPASGGLPQTTAPPTMGGNDFSEGSYNAVPSMSGGIGPQPSGGQVPPPSMTGGQPQQGGGKGGMQPATPGAGFQGGAVGGFNPGQKGGAGQLQTGVGQGVQGKLQPGVSDLGAPPPMQESGGPLFGGTVGGLIDPETFGQIGSLDQLQNFDLDRGRVEQSYMDRASSLLNPQFDQAEQRMVSDLRARGIPRGSEAFEREMSNFRRDKGETFGRLANDAVLQGGGEQSRLFGISSALGDRAAGAKSQLFQMADLLGQRDIQAQLQNANIASMNRATQFNELASLLGLQQVASPGLNNFFAPGNVDMTGAYALNQQGQMANARNSAAQKGGMLGGLGQLGSAAIGAGGWGGLLGMGE